jgi:TRAP-type mannitol/chloroaromatic compound transport system substrate-binding protein
VQNGPVLKELTEKHGVKLRMFPNDVMKVLEKATAEVMDEETKKFPNLKKVYDHQLKFISVIRPWMKASEWAFVNAIER